MKPKLNKADVQGIVNVLQENGMHPAQIRHALQAQGMHGWRYQFGGDGLRARTRRLRQAHRAICVCDKGSFSIKGGLGLCNDCLVAKWGPGTVLDSQGRLA